MIRIENRQPKAKRGYFAKCLNFKIDFFWQKDYFMYVFLKKIRMKMAMALFKRKIERKL